VWRQRTRAPRGACARTNGETQDLDAAIRRYARELRETGVTPERVLRDLKDCVRRVLAGSASAAQPRDSARSAAVMRMAVTRCIEAYYRAY